MVKVVRHQHWFWGDSYTLIMTKKEGRAKLPKAESKKYYTKLFGRRMSIEIVSEKEYKETEGEELNKINNNELIIG